MDYFVSIENNAYCHWQASLLIESFNQAGLADKLIVAVAKNDAPCLPNFVANVKKHKKLFVHENFSHQGHKCFNKLNSILLAIRNNFISYPFMVLHPDMVLLKPYEQEVKKDILFQVNEPDETLEKNLNFYISQFLTATNVDYTRFGTSFIFNNVPEAFFFKALDNLQYLCHQFGSNWALERAAWTLTLCQYYTILSMKGVYLEGNLMHNELDSFHLIHYKYGMPPVFNKHFYTYRSENDMLAIKSNPYEVLEENNSTIAMGVINKLLKNL